MSLYRFTKRKHSEDFIEGRISFGHWSIYKDDKLAEAQMDDESTREFGPNLKKTKFVIEGATIEGLIDVNIKYKAKKDFDCYILSLTTELNPQFFNLFNDVDSCVEIINERKFADRLDSILDKEGLKGYYGIVKYYSPENLLTPIKNYVDLAFRKNDKYAYQKEYRIVVAGPFKSCEDRLNIDIGCIKSLCKIHYKN